MVDPDDRWVLAYERAEDRSWLPVGWTLEIGESVLLGREGDLALGVSVPDRGISRRAAVVTSTHDGWDIEVINSNGAVVHPWGQAPFLAQRHNRLVWPRIAVRLLNGARHGVADEFQHWVLLEADTITVTPAGVDQQTRPATSTLRGDRPDPLTGGQLDALSTVFADHLQWPPALPAEPLLLRTAARRLGISESGVQERLSKARQRALRLGLHRQVGLTDPEYLYALVRAGYVALPPGGCARRRVR